MRVEKRLLKKENIAFTHSTLAAKAMRELTGSGAIRELSVLGEGGVPGLPASSSFRQTHALGCGVAVESGAAVRLEWMGNCCWPRC